MQAIQTKYLGATNHRGSRIKATAHAGSVTVPYDYALGIPENHEAAAHALLGKLDWSFESLELRSGTLKDGTFVHVLVLDRVGGE